MGKQVFLQLLDKYLDGTASPAEKRLLREYYSRLDEKSRLELSKEEEGALHQLMLQNIRSGIHEQEPVRLARLRRIRRTWYGAAAGVILLITGGYFIMRHRKTIDIAVRATHDVAPGGNRAVLTLSNGRTIILDSAGAGQLASQGNSSVFKADSGMIVYDRQPETGGSQASMPQYNTLTTPPGGQYRLILPDGSRIWLNAASSVRYPTVFVGRYRTVEITGEAYFEVAKNVRMPFEVKSGNVTIRVLGTHFDVNAYDNEADLTVTLLQGSVRVKAEGRKEQQAVITMGHQGKVSNAGNITVLKDPDVEEAVAWKEGLFQFDGTSLKEVLRQISRWYDVKIVYKDSPSIHLAGVMSRNVRLSQVVRLFQANGVHCKIENRELIVMQ